VNAGLYPPSSPVSHVYNKPSYVEVMVCLCCLLVSSACVVAAKTNFPLSDYFHLLEARVAAVAEAEAAGEGEGGAGGGQGTLCSMMGSEQG
jgi:hypothetical protein